MLVEIVPVWTVALGEECALHQRGVSDFAPALGDPSDTQTIVGLADAWHHAEEGGEVIAFRKVLDIDDDVQQYGYPVFSNALD